MPRHEIRVAKDGSVRGVMSPQLQPLVEALGGKIRRVSHVEPCLWWRRWLFHLVRLVGDRGRCAVWTRSWPGNWRINFAPIQGEIVFTDAAGESFGSHAAAVAHEVPIAITYIKGLIKE